MPLSRLAELYGVATSYSPSAGRTVRVPDAAVVAALAALGVDAGTAEAARDALAARESELAARLLPPTLVWWQGRAAPPALAALPHGTRLHVATEQGATREWAVENAAPTQPETGARTGARDDVPGGRERHGAQAGAHGGGVGGGGYAAFDAAAAPPLPRGVHRLTVTVPEGPSARVHLVVAPERMPGLDTVLAAPPAVDVPRAERAPVRVSEGEPGGAGSAAGADGAPPARVHGLLVQLYSLLSERSWGMGDLGDLAELATWAGRTLGSGFVQVNPLHSAVPGEPSAPSDPSPYRPSSRHVPDPVHLRVEDVHEYAYLGADERAEAADLLERAAALRFAVLHEEALIDRDAVWALKRRALELVARVPLGPGRQAAYCDFLVEAGEALEDHATWCALAEVHGPDWASWPPALRDPRSVETVRARRDLLDRVDFHSRLAWLADTQLAAAQRAARDAGMAVGIVHDLAVGVHPGGSDAWAQQECLAAGMSVGAPPDAFNARGQDWGLPPWRPDRLAAAGYAPYRRLLRDVFRRAGGVRIDHVMGLFRLWWVPRGQEAAEGTYVHYDAEAMLAVLALEAHRAGALVIGEDLGTVAPGVRETLRAHGVLGTSVLWFERDVPGGGDGGGADGADTVVAAGAGAGVVGRPLAPERWRADCLATVTTHDLPPTAARFSGDDVRLRHSLGLLNRPFMEEQTAAEAETAQWLEMLARLGLLFEGSDPAGPAAARSPGSPGGPGSPDHPENFAYTGEEERIRAVHRFLRRTPARMIGLWLPDAIGDRRPQNLPGTWREYPNWRLPIADGEGRPVTLEQLAGSARLHALLAVLREAPI